MYRQGDILLIPVPTSEVVEAEKEGAVVARQNGSLILAYGERTGHTHAISEPEVELIEFRGSGYLRAITEFAVVHQEHAPLYLPSGTFRIVRQREYVPSAVTPIRQISD